MANLALFDAIAKSQLATNWQPAAVATPLTSAITGYEELTIACIKTEHERNSSLKKLSPLSGSFLA